MGDTKLHLVRRGTAIILAATLSTSMVPALALADADGAGAPQATASAAATTQNSDGFYLEAGKAYTVPVTYGDDYHMGMMGQYFASTAQVTYADGAYQVVLSIPDQANYEKIGDITANGTTVKQSNGTYTVSASTLKSVFSANIMIPKMAGMFPNGVRFTVTFDTSELPTEAPAPVVDKTALKAAIDQAKAIEQGNKTDDAFKALQDAIATAEKAYGNDNIPQQGVDGVLAQLKAAIDTFNASADKVPEKPETPESPDGYALEEGKEYTVPVALMKEDGATPSMAAQFFEKDGKVVYRDGSYQVTFAVTADGLQYIKKVSADAIEDLGNGSYRVTVKSLDNLIPLTFNLQTPVGAMSQTGYLKLDTTSLPKADGNQGGNQGGDNNNGGQQGGNNNQNNNNNGNQGGNNGGQEQPGDTAQFQVGHTYQVPIAFMKQNSSEASMAAQYFYTTALVRPQQDGTFNVSFSATSEGLTHIIQLAHNGATLSNDNGTFTVNIPAATQDTVVPISMTIKEMQQLGGGPQTADLHLYLTQAKDLGTGQDGLPPAGAPGATAGNGAGTAKGSALAKTADSAPTAAVTGIAAMAAAAVAAAGTMLRRRFNK